MERRRLPSSEPPTLASRTEPHATTASPLLRGHLQDQRGSRKHERLWLGHFSRSLLFRRGGRRRSSRSSSSSANPGGQCFQNNPFPEFHFLGSSSCVGTARVHACPPRADKRYYLSLTHLLYSPFSRGRKRWMYRWIYRGHDWCSQRSTNQSSLD